MLSNREVLDMSSDRFEKWLAAFSAVTRDDIETAIANEDHFFGSEVFEAKYKDNERGIRRYLMMYRVYHFLLYGWFYDARRGEEPLFQDEINYPLWFGELARRPEFMDVHRRFGQFYPQFSAHVEKQMQAAAGS